MHLAFVLSPEQSRPPSTISIPAFVLSSNGPRGAKQGSSDSAHQRFAVWPFRCASSWQRRCGSPASPGRRQKQPPRPKSQRSDGPMHEVPEMDSCGFPSRYQQRCAAQTAHKPHQLRIMDKDSVEKHRRRRVEVEMEVHGSEESMIRASGNGGISLGHHSRIPVSPSISINNAFARSERGPASGDTTAAFS